MSCFFLSDGGGKGKGKTDGNADIFSHFLLGKKQESEQQA